jgi:1,2-diacylglycerol 3-beta-galactosyltransferase
MLTDFADYPPHFWIERESEYLIGGTEKAVKQAQELGHSRSRIFRASGMVLKPPFYEQPVVDRAAERAKLGLDPECPTGIVLFGGQGSRAMLDIAERLDATPDRLQLIMLCGHNTKLADKLRELPLKKRMFVEGFSSQVDYYMSLADFFIGKPGPGCISEALQFHLPVITECNAATMPQERYNAQWLVENRLGVALKSFREIAFGVHLLLQPEMFEEFRQNARNHSNRALFEVPEILEEVFERHAIQTVPVISFPGDLNLPRPNADPVWAALT